MNKKKLGVIVVSMGMAMCQNLIPVAANATAGASAVTKIAVYAGSELVGLADGSGYRGSWRATGNGNVALVAVVTTADGKKYTSTYYDQFRFIR